MNLSFTQEINNRPNYFIEKIWAGIFEAHPQLAIQYPHFQEFHLAQFGEYWTGAKDGQHQSIGAKLHTIRRAERWNTNDEIQLVINGETDNVFQFAPTVKCTAVQTIQIKYISPEKYPLVYIDQNVFYDSYNGVDKGILELVPNDGFEALDDFFAYFNADFSGQIVHWTDLRY